MEEMIYDNDSIERIITCDINGLRNNGQGEHRNDAITDSFPESVNGWRLLFGYPSVILLFGDMEQLDIAKTSLKELLSQSYDFEFKEVTSKDFNEIFVKNANKPSGKDGGLFFVNYMKGFPVNPNYVDKLLMQECRNNNYIQGGLAMGSKAFGPFHKYQEDDFFKSGTGCVAIRTGWNIMICINSTDSDVFNIDDFKYLDNHEKLYGFRF